MISEMEKELREVTWKATSGSKSSKVGVVFLTSPGLASTGRVVGGPKVRGAALEVRRRRGKQ